MSTSPFSLSEAISLLREVAAAGLTPSGSKAKTISLPAELTARVRDAVDRFETVALAAEPRGYRTPTRYIDRFGDAVTLLCGRRPSDELIRAWLLDEPSADLLQHFVSEHGPSWAQGLGVLDAARALADQPTEGDEHEMFDDYIAAHQAG